MNLGQKDYHLEKDGNKEYICISKEALEKWRDHYRQVKDNMPETHPSYQFMKGFYAGHIETLMDILQHFEWEEEEG